MSAAFLLFDDFCQLTKVNLRSGPSPPWFRGVLAQAKWVNSESVETPTTSVLIPLNFSKAALKAKISVGQTTNSQRSLREQAGLLTGEVLYSRVIKGRKR